MDIKKTVSLETVDKDDQAGVGAKAAGLARLIGIGLPVPPGFCITASAYREHLDSNHLSDDIRSILDRSAAASPQDRGNLLKELRGKIAGAPLGDGIREEIENRCGALVTGAAAVRSSATAEDLPGYSFAGQYDTYLGISGLRDCLEAVKGCWASLWTERAFEYRERNGFDHLGIEMAVIVQELVPAEASGVIFTADPVSGRTDRMIIEAVYGLGDNLVSGKTSPDRIVLAREDLHIVSTTISEKTLESVAGADGVVREKAVDPGRAGRPCISEPEAGRLGEMAARAESAFGVPQDMEWAICGGEISFLQARPITTLHVKKSWEDRQVWSNMNAGEVLPDVVTPMTWGLVETLIKPIFDSVFARIGIDFGDHPLLGQVAGRAYFNLNTCVAALRSFPGLSERDWNEIFGGDQGNIKELEDLSIPGEDLPDLHFSLTKMILKLPSFVWWYLSHSMKRGESFVTEIRGRTKRREHLDPASLSEDGLLTNIRRAMDDLYGSASAIIYAAKGMFYFKKLDQICRAWLGDSEGEFAGRFCCGLDGMDIAEAGFELWRLALKADDDAGVKAIILSGGDYEACREKISQVEGGGGFLAAWDGFMERHGHHTRGELELFNPRWSEKPDHLLEMVRGYLGGIGEIDPLVKHGENAGEREALAVRCRVLLINPLKRWVFGFCLRQAQRGSVLRENIKSEAVRILAVIRRMLLELGERLARRDILESKEDVFFLRLEDIDPVLRGKAGFEAKKIVASRRAEYEKNLSITPPKVITGKFDPDDFVTDEIDEKAGRLTGLAVSPGVATGPARVMLRSGSEEIYPGEILVAPFTDPGWTPHFIVAAAVVMDLGGLLSHGSIVAREYGIPAVVNVGTATRIIKTGQRVKVDGTRGIVRILR